MAAAVSPFNPAVMAGNVLLITGGASGIGLGIAQQFAAHKAKGVVIMGRRQAFLDAAVEGIVRRGGAAVASQVRADRVLTTRWPCTGHALAMTRRPTTHTTQARADRALTVC